MIIKNVNALENRKFANFSSSASHTGLTLLFSTGGTHNEGINKGDVE